MKFKIGDRVVPIKSSFKQSLTPYIAKFVKEHGYIYVTIVNRGHTNTCGYVDYVCNTTVDNSGDYFMESDLTPYVESFVLPEKWIIRSTLDTHDIILRWFKENQNWTWGDYKKEEPWGFRNDIHDSVHYTSPNPEGYTEISFETFSKYILNQDMNKELLGYKLKEDCKQYEEAASQICGYKLGKLDTIANGTSFLTNSRDKQNLEKAGVLNLWFEPVYAQDELKVGNWAITTQEDCKMYNKYSKGEVFKITKVSNEYVYYEENSSVLKHRIRKANQQEICDHLVNLAKEKGFVEGCTINHSYNGSGNFKLKNGADYTYFEDRDLLTYFGWGIYKDGVWATIIPQKEVVKVTCSNNGDIEVEISTDGIKYDGTTLSIKVIQEILNFTTKVNGWAVVPEMFSIGCREGIDRDDLQKVLDAYNKLNK